MKQVISTEEFNLEHRRDEIRELTRKLNKLRAQQENLQNTSNKLSNDINEYIFQLKKFSDYHNEMLPEAVKDSI